MIYELFYFSCITNAVFSLFGMPLSDISDKDMDRYQRR